MNYRHAFHAGNFADVHKHAVLARAIEYLKRKEGAFRVHDLHAGAGAYDLSSAEAARTGEWIEGVGRILAAEPPAEVEALLAPWLHEVRRLVKGGTVAGYPGSPALTRALLRKQDWLSLYELHPQEYRLLAARFAGDFQTRAMELDGWLAPGAHLPPKEKRGLVLIDPPFEKEGDFDRIVDALERIHRRWPGGMAIVWYPIKSGGGKSGSHASEFVEQLRHSGLPDLMRSELMVRFPKPETGLAGSGLIIKNPPFTLESEMQGFMPWLTEVLAQDEGASWLQEQLTEE